MSKTLSVIIPMFNEENTIVRVLDKVHRVKLEDGIAKQIVVVDDASSDRSYEIVEEYIRNQNNSLITFIKHEVNKGKGAALHTGIEKATGDWIIVQDADLEYDPNEFSRLLQPILDGYADVVYGSRFIGSNPHRILFFWHSIGNAFLTFLSNMFTNLNLTDMETCYKMFKSEIIKPLNLKERRFGFEPEVTAKMSRVPGNRIYEVGISYYGRSYSEGKKINWKDGVRAIYCILKYNIFSKN